MAQPMEERSFIAGEHPRVPAGSAGGGEFGTKAAAKATKPAATHKQAPAHHTAKPASKPLGPLTSTLSFDAANNHGPGYDSPNGDPHVKKFQAALNALGLTDLRGRKLDVDGKLGPLTTQSIKAAQRRLGLKPDGHVTPAFYEKLLAAKSLPKPAAKPKPEAKPMTTPARAATVGDDPGDSGPQMTDDDHEADLASILADLSDDELRDFVQLVDACTAEGEAS